MFGKILLTGLVATEVVLAYKTAEKLGMLDKPKQMLKDYVDKVKDAYNEGRHNVYKAEVVK